MEDEASILLDGKTLNNLRVVDLKQELEKRGLSKSGSKKDLVKRLKVQLEFEKLCGERKSAADCDLKLDLDADTEQNEFVQQYLAQQQKIYAEQKEAKRRIELEETLKGSDEKGICDSTKDDDDDDDQTEPDEPEDEDSKANIASRKTVEVTKTHIVSTGVEADSSEIQDDVDQNSSQLSRIEIESPEVQDESEQETSQSSKVEIASLQVQDDVVQEASQRPTEEAAILEAKNCAAQETFRPSTEGAVSSGVSKETSAPLKVKVASLDDIDQETTEPSEVEAACLSIIQETFQPSTEEAACSGVSEETSALLKVKVASLDIIDQETTEPSEVEAACLSIIQETSEPLKLEEAGSDVIYQETFQPSKVDAANSEVQYGVDVQETLANSNAASLPEELSTDALTAEYKDCQNQIISSSVPVDSSSETVERLEIFDNVNNQITSSEITDTANIISSTEIHDTIGHQAEELPSSEIIQDKDVKSSIDNTQEISHQDASSEVKETHTDSREIVTLKSELLPKMEPTKQFSSVPYSLMDIQLPESPGNVKSKSTSETVESESVNNTEETHSNGIDSEKSSNKSSRKTDSKDVSSEKVCSSENNSNLEKLDELTQRTKESNSDDSKVVESKKKENEFKSSRSKTSASDRKTRKSKDNRDSRSKSRERKRTRRSSEDSPSRRHSRSRSRERAHKLKEDSRSRRDSRSRSKEKDRRTRKYEKNLDTRKVSHSRRDSRSKSKEDDRKTRKASIDTRSRKAGRSQRKSRSVSNDSKSGHSSDSGKEFQKGKDKSRETKQKRGGHKKSSDPESDKSSSSSSDSSPSRSSERKGRSTKQKVKHQKHDSSEGTRSSRSRSPANKKLVKKSDDHSKSSVTNKLGRQSSKDNDKNSRSRSRDSSPFQKKSKSKSAEKSDKQKETSHKTEISDSDKVPKSPSHEDRSIKKKSKISSEPKTFSTVESEEVGEHKLKISGDESSKSRSRESSPCKKPSKNKSLEQESDSVNLVKSSKTKRNESSGGSRSRSREKSPESKIKRKSRSPADTPVPQENSKRESPKSRSRSREHSPVESKLSEPPSDSVDSPKTDLQEKEPESGNSDNQASRSRSRESSPVQAVKMATDESSGDSAALTKRTRQKSQSSMDGRDSRSRSREKSPVVKRIKISFDKPSVDSLDTSKHQTEPVKTTTSESDIPGAVKKGNITIVKKEPIKQKLRIKRDNVVISSQNKREEKESISEKSALSEPNEESQKEPTSAPVRSLYVSRKIKLSSRSQSVTCDEPKGKRSKWGNFASSQKTSTVNISTTSLKSWFPDFKLLKDPTPEEPASLTKEESDMEIPVNKPEEEFKQVLGAKRFQEPQREMQMEVDPVETGPVSKILFIQNLVRPFTLNQLKELLRETGNFIEEDFWIDKIKSKCFVTYETEEEAIKTRSHLNGTRWPSSNPKILSVEFSSEEELTNHRSGNDAPKTVLQPVPEPNDMLESRASHSVDEFRKKDHDLDRKRDRSKQQLPVREWDKDKITQESPDRERSRKDADKSKYLDKKEKKDSKRRANEDTPAKLLDDLFQKTKSSPCIYWLPLSDAQLQERLESRRVRRLEREKQNQQREREEAENKAKRPRSRNRTRDGETRRSSTRSRSPATRRR